MAASDESPEDGDQLRERFPDEVYAAHADYVTLSMKRMTARRMVGWLREYAAYARVSGADETAAHAEHVADALADELPEEDRLSGDTETDDDKPARQWVGYECGNKVWDTGVGGAPRLCPNCGAEAVRRQSSDPTGTMGCPRSPTDSESTEEIDDG